MKKAINQFIQLVLIAFITGFIFGVVVRVTKLVGGL